MIAPPEYKAELITLKKNEGIEILQKVLKIVEEEISEIELKCMKKDEEIKGM
jgi:hypothetical protein